MGPRSFLLAALLLASTCYGQENPEIVPVGKTGGTVDVKVLPHVHTHDDQSRNKAHVDQEQRMLDASQGNAMSPMSESPQYQAPPPTTKPIPLMVPQPTQPSMDHSADTTAEQKMKADKYAEYAKTLAKANSAKPASDRAAEISAFLEKTEATTAEGTTAGAATNGLLPELALAMFVAYLMF